MPFTFNEKSLALAKNAVAKYPEGRQASAVMELLWVAQRQNANWLSVDAITHVAQFLSMPQTKVMEIATFYSMYNLKPIGKYFVQACGTTPCMLMGAKEVAKTLQEEIAKAEDASLFSYLEVECLGACSSGPVVQINEAYHENLTPEKAKSIITKMREEGI